MTGTILVEASNLAVDHFPSFQDDMVGKDATENKGPRSSLRNWFFPRKNKLAGTGRTTPVRDQLDIKPSESALARGDEEKQDTEVDPALMGFQSNKTTSAHALTANAALLLNKRAIAAAEAKLSPQGFLDAMIRSRGYSTRRYKTLDTAYYNKATALQLASFDAHLMALCRSPDTHGALRTALGSGISPNPCNEQGESLLHAACRRGEHAAVQIMLECGATVQVSDDYGRTPLHEACWNTTPCFETVRLLLDQDIRLLHLTDSRCAVPLSYVRREHWGVWIEFFEKHCERYWPGPEPHNMEHLEQLQAPPPLALLPPNSRPVPNPPEALTCEMAQMVASGKIQADEARFLFYDKEAIQAMKTTGRVDDYDTSRHEDDDVDIEETSTSAFTWNADDLSSILDRLPTPQFGGAAPPAKMGK